MTDKTTEAAKIEAAIAAMKDKEKKDAEGGNDKLASALGGIAEALKGLGERIEALETGSQRDGVDPALTLATPTMADSRKRDSEVAEAQHRCDSVAQQFGERAPPPMSGEAPRAYRTRLLRDFRQYSQPWKDKDLVALPEDVFAIAEEQIYADAVKRARTPNTEPGRFIERSVTTPAGHRITEWHGLSSTWMDEFGPPVRQYVTRFNVPQGVGTYQPAA